MKLNLTSDEMLRVWKLRRYNEPLRSDCVVTRADGVDLDGLQRMEMREWYLKLLDEGDLSLLEVSDIAADVAVVINQDGSGTIKLPAECRRVVEVQLDGWFRPARIVGADSPIGLLQCSAMSRGGSVEPVAVVRDGCVDVYTPVGVGVRSLKCVMEPSDGGYVMDERALSLIEPID